MKFSKSVLFIKLNKSQKSILTLFNIYNNSTLFEVKSALIEQHQYTISNLVLKSCILNSQDKFDIFIKEISVLNGLDSKVWKSDYILKKLFKKATLNPNYRNSFSLIVGSLDYLLVYDYFRANNDSQLKTLLVESLLSNFLTSLFGIKQSSLFVLSSDFGRLLKTFIRLLAFFSLPLCFIGYILLGSPIFIFNEQPVYDFTSFSFVEYSLIVSIIFIGVLIGYYGAIFKNFSISFTGENLLDRKSSPKYSFSIFHGLITVTLVILLVLVGRSYNNKIENIIDLLPHSASISSKEELLKYHTEYLKAQTTYENHKKVQNSILEKFSKSQQLSLHEHPFAISRILTINHVKNPFDSFIINYYKVFIFIIFLVFSQLLILYLDFKDK